MGIGPWARSSAPQKRADAGSGDGSVGGDDDDDGDDYDDGFKDRRKKSGFFGSVIKLGCLEIFEEAEWCARKKHNLGTMTGIFLAPIDASFLLVI